MRLTCPQKAFASIERGICAPFLSGETTCCLGQPSDQFNWDSEAAESPCMVLHVSLAF